MNNRFIDGTWLLLRVSCIYNEIVEEIDLMLLGSQRERWSVFFSILTPGNK